MKIIITTFLTFLFFSLPCLAADQFEMWLWGKGDHKNDPRVLETTEHHACSGEIVRIIVNKMPRNEATFEGEKVIELSPTGEIINQWNMPVHYIVLGIKDSRIITGFRNIEKALVINTDDSLGYAPVPPLNFKSAICPRSAKDEFMETAYLRCFEYQDMNSKKTRTLTYEGPCT